MLSNDSSVDPVGACVGLRGIRIQNIVNELQGEKIDVIQWSKDDAVFISHALSPAQPLRVELDQEERAAVGLVDANVGEGVQQGRDQGLHEERVDEAETDHQAQSDRRDAGPG